MIAFNINNLKLAKLLFLLLVAIAAGKQDTEYLKDTWQDGAFTQDKLTDEVTQDTSNIEKDTSTVQYKFTPVEDTNQDPSFLPKDISSLEDTSTLQDTPIPAQDTNQDTSFLHEYTSTLQDTSTLAQDKNDQDTSSSTLPQDKSTPNLPNLEDQDTPYLLQRILLFLSYICPSQLSCILTQARDAAPGTFSLSLFVVLVGVYGVCFMKRE